MADTRDNGGPAFPFQGVEFQELYATKPGVKTLVDVTFQGIGVSLRDYFAAKAMQGWISTYVERDMTFPTGNSAKYLSENAYAMADAMLEARSNPSTK